MSAADDIRDGIGEAFNVLREEFIPDVSSIALLKSSGTTDAFETVLTVSSKWFFDYQKFTGTFLLEISDDSPSLTTAMASATHVQVGSDIYEIRDGDVVPPTNDKPWIIQTNLFRQRNSWQGL